MKTKKLFLASLLVLFSVIGSSSMFADTGSISDETCEPQCGDYPNCYECKTCADLGMGGTYPDCYPIKTCQDIGLCGVWGACYECTQRTCSEMGLCGSYPSCYSCGGGGCCPTVGTCTNGIETYQTNCSQCSGTGANEVCVNIPTVCSRCKDGPCSCPAVGSCTNGTEQYSLSCSDGSTQSCMRCAGTGSATQCISATFTTMPNLYTTSISNTLCSNGGTFTLGTVVAGVRFSGMCSRTNGGQVSVDNNAARCTWQVGPITTTQKIYGTVTDAENNPLSGITIVSSRIGGEAKTAITGNDGKYSITVPTNHTYTVSAQNSEKYTFSSTSQSNITIVDVDVQKDFKSNEIKAGQFKIYGTVKDSSGKALGGIKVVLNNKPDTQCGSSGSTSGKYSCVNTQIPHPTNPGSLSTINKATLYKDGVLIKSETDKCIGNNTLEMVSCKESDAEEFTKGYVMCETGTCNQGVCDGTNWTGPIYPYNSREEFLYINQPYCGEDDGGKDYYKKGSTRIYSFFLDTGSPSWCSGVISGQQQMANGCFGNFEGTIAGTDQCTYSGSNCGTKGCVIESYCKSLGSSYEGKSTDILSETYACPNGCSDGACIKLSTANAQSAHNCPNGGYVITDASGNYEFTGLYTGTYQVNPENQYGYSFPSQVVTISGSDKRIDFTSTGSSSHAIFGTVTNGSNGALMPAIKVWLTIDASRVSTTTNAQGQYRFNDLKTGDYVVKPEDSIAHIFTQKAITLGDTDESIEVNFISSHVEPDQHDIFGIVRDNAGKPLSGIRVDLKDGSLTGKNVTTNNQGNYRFEKLAEGEYFVEPESKNGYTFYSQKAIINNANVEINFTSGELPPGKFAIYGVITDKDSNSLDNIRIEIDHLGSKRYTVTQSGGQYRFENLGKGGYLVKPEDADRHVFVLKGVNVVDADVELNFKSGELPPGEFAIFGTVTNTAGTPINGISVTLNHNNDTFTAITDDVGQYRFGTLPVGGYVVQAQSTGDYTFSSPESVYVINADVQVNFTSTERLFTINGIITKGNDIPLEGILVYIEHNGEKNSISTNKEGRYEFTSLKGGEYNLRPENTDKFIFPFGETINLVDSDAQVNFIAITQGEEIPEEVITELLSRNGDVVEWLNSLSSGDGTEVVTAGTSNSTLSFDPIFTPNSLITLLNEGYVPLANSYSPIGLSLVSKYDTICGNGQVEPGETCDDGAKNGQTGFCSPDCLYIGEVRLVDYQMPETGLEANIIQVPGEIGGKVVENAQKIGDAIENKISQVTNSVKQLILNNTTPEMRKIAVKTAEYTAIGATSILGVTAAGLQVLLYQGQWMTYTVKVGDTLESLGGQFNMTNRALQAKNGLGNSEQLKPGTKIHVKNRHFLEKGYLDQLKTVLNDRHLGKFSDKITKMFAKK